jgi:hypothetical protein
MHPFKVKMNPIMPSFKKINLLKSEKPGRSLSSSSLPKSQYSKHGAASNPMMLTEKTRSFAAELNAAKANLANDSVSGGDEYADSMSRRDLSLLETAKGHSETKIHFKLASEDNLTRESSFVKDLPMTE